MALLGRRRGNAAVLRDVQKFRDGLAQDEGRAPEQAAASAWERAAEQALRGRAQEE